MSSGPGTGLTLGLGIQFPPMGATTSGRVGLAVCPGWAWPAREEAHPVLSVPFPCASMLLCPPEWPVLVSAVSTFTGCHIEISCLIKITSTMVCGLASGSKRGNWCMEDLVQGSLRHREAPERWGYS